MKKLLLVLLLFIGVEVKSQDTLKKDSAAVYQYNLLWDLMRDKAKAKERHRIIDSICLSIEKNRKTYSSIVDTLKVVDVNNPLKVVDFFVWKYFFTTSPKRKLFLVSDDHKKTRIIYYFQDTLLIKVLKNDLSNKSAKSFYYDASDNSKPETEIKELETTSNDKDFYKFLADAKVDLRYFEKNPQKFK